MRRCLASSTDKSSNIAFPIPKVEASGDSDMEIATFLPSKKRESEKT